MLCFRVRERGLHGQADTDAKKPVLGHSENGRTGTEQRLQLATIGRRFRVVDPGRVYPDIILQEKKRGSGSDP